MVIEMNFVRFSLTQHFSPTSAAIIGAISTLNKGLWLARAKQLESFVQQKPLKRRLVERDYYLELSVAFILRRYIRFGNLPRLDRFPELMDAYSFLFLYWSIRKNLSDAGRSRLDGMVRDGLNQTIGPLAFEFLAVAHVLNRGFEIAFADLEGYGRVDLIARKDNCEIEIECKHIGSGCQAITRDDFQELIDAVLVNRTSACLKDLNSGLCCINLNTKDQTSSPRRSGGLTDAAALVG